MKFGPTFFAGAAHDFDRETGCGFVAAPQRSVRLLVLAAMNWLIRVAFRTHDLDTVVTGALCQRGAVGVIVDGLFDVWHRSILSAGTGLIGACSGDGATRSIEKA